MLDEQTNQPETPEQILFEALYAITFAVQDLALDSLLNRYRSDKSEEGAFDFARRAIAAHIDATAPPTGEE